MLEDFKKYLGQKITVMIDRPLGSVHPKYPEMIYPLNYGYIENTRAGDGEELDAYVLGVDHPLSLFIGKCIAIIQRLDNNEDKLVVASDCMYFSEEQIKELTNFQEKYFKIEIIK
jgi:inorganic pyrophosphatase